MVLEFAKLSFIQNWRHGEVDQFLNANNLSKCKTTMLKVIYQKGKKKSWQAKESWNPLAWAYKKRDGALNIHERPSWGIYFDHKFVIDDPQGIHQGVIKVL